VRPHWPADAAVIAELKAYAGHTDLRGNPAYGNAVHQALKTLAEDRTEARQVRQWLTSNQSPVQAAQLAEWATWPLQFGEQGPVEQYGFLELSRHLAEWSPIAKWERISAATRAKMVRRIVDHSRQLAALLTDPQGPPLPKALGLFDNRDAVEWLQGTGFVQSMSRPMRVTDIGGSYNTKRTYVAPDSRSFFEQEIAPMLTRLADYAEEVRTPRLRDARPKTGNPDQRALARHLARWFNGQGYRVNPNTVIADIITLMMPEAELPATADSVREWLGVK
jgi:hypothetical protein